MNLYKTILFISILSAGSFACEGFLDRQPLDQLTEGSFYKTASDANRALLSVYTPMMDVEWSGKGWMITEIPSDNTQAGGLDPDFTPIDNFTVASDNLPIANYWAVHYRQIVLANVAIEKVSGMEIEEELKESFVAEARFLRAVAYFDLVRIYGAVPLVTKAPVYGDDLLPSRTPVAEVYAFIASDLEYAAERLPVKWDGVNVGRATAGAAMAYLAKVYLTTREYVKARDNARKVIDLGVYALMDDFADNFELETSDNNKESVFQVQYTGCGSSNTGNALQAFFAPWGEGITKDRDGWGSQIPTGPQLSNPGTTIFDAFETGDLRIKPTIMTPNAHYPSVNPGDGGYTYPSAGASATQINIKKYVIGSGPNVCFMSTPQNVHLVRYSDVLLTYAESIMEIEGGVSSNPAALQAFNEVRNRAGLASLTVIDKATVLRERRTEFAFEGQRWFDLLRSGRAVEILSLHGKKPNAEKLLFPIPDSEIKINPNLTQNPGY
ncbi:MAG: RagB/SusD family nutrient uptake outer membrane protein [Bacteroidia bacterium]|nr:RagB/SusD family nutrient uptake outer membrane protein [Bacteroidia bacterium]